MPHRCLCHAGVCVKQVFLFCRWDAFALAVDDATLVEETDLSEPSKTSKRAKKREREAREESVRKAEHSRLDASSPSSIDDFERLALASPNSSFVWIRYMAFLLNMSEVAKARALAERALTVIDYRYVTDSNLADTGC